MASSLADRAIADAQRVGKAILKSISANDAGLTGGHQYGYLLPISAWELFTPHAPEKGVNGKSNVKILWQDGRETSSVVTWYGKAKHEYRLTCFGRDFPFRTADNVGDLLILIPESHTRFVCYVLDLEEDIEEFQSALGVELIESSVIYDRDAPPVEESQDDCIQRKLRAIVDTLNSFPATASFSATARDAVASCVRSLKEMTADERLMLWHDAEYALFRMTERKICAPEIGGRQFRSVDEFITTANRILQRRKSRAGWSLEHHVDQLLTDAGIPHAMRASDIEGTPDVIIPSIEAYNDLKYPIEKLMMVGVKSTCKDRWRQVLEEAPRLRIKHLVTIQQGNSPNQLMKMARKKVQLVVPKQFHRGYPPQYRSSLMNMEQFLDSIRKRLA